MIVWLKEQKLYGSSHLYLSGSSVLSVIKVIAQNEHLKKEALSLWIKWIHRISIDGLQLQIDKIVCQQDVWWRSSSSVFPGDCESHTQIRTNMLQNIKNSLKPHQITALFGQTTARKIVAINRKRKLNNPSVFLQVAFSSRVHLSNLKLFNDSKVVCGHSKPHKRHTRAHTHNTVSDCREP